MKVALVQLNSVADKAANLGAARREIERVVSADRPDLIVLPETWDYVGGSISDRLAAAEPFPDSAAYQLCQRLARESGAWVHAGSIRERIEGETRAGNTTVVFDRSGREVARYRKIHLFDVTLPDGVVHRESDAIVPGSSVVTYDLEGVRVGCAICYDLRFPELFAALRRAGAQLVALPSAFTLPTGRDHWEVLCRARAIETQTWFLAPGQWGTHTVGSSERACFGRSMVIDPWGIVVAQAPDGVGSVCARLDIGRVESVRSRFPVASHRVLP